MPKPIFFCIEVCIFGNDRYIFLSYTDKTTVVKEGDERMQLAWFEKQNWLEIRNAQPEISIFDGHRFHSCNSFFSRERHHIYLLEEDLSLFRIDGIEYSLDSSLRVCVEDDIVSIPRRGELRIRIYSERERRWRLILCSAGDEDISLRRYQRDFGWCYVQIQWWIDHRIGPNTVVWIPPKKNIPVVVETGKKNGKPFIQFHHDELGDFAFQWYRQPLLSNFSTEKEYLWVDEMGAEIDLSVGMVGDRFILWSPLGWSFIYQGEEVQELILERKPAHFSAVWARVEKPYRSVKCESYNACLLKGLNNLVVHSPLFSSWVVRERRFSLCSHLVTIDGENLSGDLLWSMNHV